jgi:hypothetical protein
MLPSKLPPAALPVVTADCGTLLRRWQLIPTLLDWKNSLLATFPTAETESLIQKAFLAIRGHRQWSLEGASA